VIETAGLPIQPMTTPGARPGRAMARSQISIEDLLQRLDPRPKRWEHPRTQFSSARRRRWQRPEWRIARFTRRQPGLALWLLVFAMVGLPLAQQELAGAKWLGDRDDEGSIVLCDEPVLFEVFSRAVNEALLVVGHGLNVNQVLVTEGGPVAAYVPLANTILVRVSMDAADSDLTWIAAHECVHALFTFAGLDRYAYLDPDYALRIEETTAYVLGSYIAEEVENRRCGNGARVRTNHLEWYRAQCDPKNPTSRHREARRMRDTIHIDNYPEERVKSLEVHFWSPWLVDEIDEICRANPDPWDAAHAVAKRYRLID